MKAGPALFLGFVLLGLITAFPIAIVVIVGVSAPTAVLTWALVAAVRAVDRRDDARATLVARAEQQHAWVIAGDDRGTYGEYKPAI